MKSTFAAQTYFYRFVPDPSQKLLGVQEKFQSRRKDWRKERMMRAIRESEDYFDEGAKKRLAGYVAEQNQEMIGTMAALIEGKSWVTPTPPPPHKLE